MATKPPRSEANLQPNKQKRPVNSTATEAARPPEERLMNRQDFDAQVNEQVGLSHEHALAQMQEWFVEFLLDDNFQSAIRTWMREGSSRKLETDPSLHHS